LLRGATLHLDRAPDKSNDMAALQNGAKMFVNYCLNCHSASYMRYNRLKDIGLSDAQIKDNLMFTAEKVGEPMKIAMQRADAKVWFGAAPPDLTMIAGRAPPSSVAAPTGSTPTCAPSTATRVARPAGTTSIFENVGMPHVLWELQGEQVMGADHKLTLVKPGKLKPQEYDAVVGDLVAYLKYMGEPVANSARSLA
jgi:ubiquinol-cytochrome c reductase cytochrome c1 subunit